MIKFRYELTGDCDLGWSKQKLRSVFCGLAIGAAVIGIGSGVAAVQEAMHPAAEGAQYLETQGYTTVEGGMRKIFSGCARNVMGREYSVTNPQTGQTTKATVCFTTLGPKRPLLGG